MTESNRVRTLWKRALIAAAIVVAPLTDDLSAGNPVHIRVWPATSMAPTSFTVRVMIARQASNRWIKVSVESENYFGSSEGQLEGERSSRLRVVQFRDVPAGTYEVRAVVLDQDGDVTGAGHTTAMVIGR